jgi:hypothetical protein
LYTNEEITSKKEKIMEPKKSKTGAIIGTLAAVLLCGCPGLCICLFGVLTTFGLGTGNLDIGNLTKSGSLPTWSGYVMLCVSILFIAIPVVVGILTLRDKKPKVEVLPPDEPLPPAS